MLLKSHEAPGAPLSAFRWGRIACSNADRLGRWAATAERWASADPGFATRGANMAAPPAETQPSQHRYPPAAAGQAQHVASGGDPGQADRLQSVAATVRDSVAGLRSLLVDIYPPSLRDAGLASALHDLVRGASGHDAAVVAETDAEAADAAPEPQQEIMFRIAQEALRNAVRHAGAGHIMLRLTPTDQGGTLLEVQDDGRGFDGAIAAAEGHFGLRLMTDAARHGGGRLSLLSVPGAGTRIRYEVTAP
jgi:two-component system NarL family sensor kinase